MAKRGRGRPKGSLNKKTLEKLDQSSNGIKKEDISLGETQKEVLKEANMAEAHDILDEVIASETKKRNGLQRNFQETQVL